MAKITIEKLMVKLDDLSKIDVSIPLEKSCMIVENTAKKNCPVDTGQLRNSIRHVIKDSVGEVGTNVEYAPYVELGTGLFAANGDGRKDVPWRYQSEDGKWHTTSGQKPQPYLQPALENNRDAIMQIFKEEISKELGK